METFYQHSVLTDALQLIHIQSYRTGTVLQNVQNAMRSLTKQLVSEFLLSMEGFELQARGQVLGRPQAHRTPNTSLTQLIFVKQEELPTQCLHSAC